jgi:hypothetical protein
LVDRIRASAFPNRYIEILSQLLYPAFHFPIPVIPFQQVIERKLGLYIDLNSVTKTSQNHCKELTILQATHSILMK